MLIIPYVNKQQFMEDLLDMDPAELRSRIEEIYPDLLRSRDPIEYLRETQGSWDQETLDDI